MSKRNATRRYLNCAVAAALGLGAGLVHAAEPAAPGAGFVQSGSGAVVMTGTGDCLRSGTWEPGSTAPGCADYQPEPVADATPDSQPAPKPEVAEIEPAPAPVETAAFERSLDARALFPFDSAELTDEGKSKLDELVASVEGDRPVSKVAIDAYADHIGETAYNDSFRSAAPRASPPTCASAWPRRGPPSRPAATARNRRLPGARRRGRASR